MNNFAANVYQYWPILTMIAVVVANRLIIQSSLRYLSDDQKVRLVDAAQRNKWAYLAITVAFLLFFVNPILGGTALAVYLITAMSVNFVWAKNNDMPRQYRDRALFANLLVIVFVGVIVVFAY